ncbi:FHA domain-containing protein [Nocardioides massiliensis]|uniref:FHA domain-containing protein n=1 Tax=Nocardioides massiliensis TaxID=1325935 RepID=A0ABT9NNB9_9ACTN|nr:FHA domain-containing protein [Nocardioides massiliensis]MDP9821929.1 hypothetical protein [Nocardioides massiliensis]
MTRTAPAATVTDLLPRTGPFHAGAELPRLVLPAGRGWEDAVQLLTETTAIGSAESAGLRLPGLSPVQAVVRRGADGCYRLAALASAPEVRVDGELLEVGHEAVLTDGSSIEVGLWYLTFATSPAVRQSA